MAFNPAPSILEGAIHNGEVKDLEQTILSMRDIVKEFPGVVAVNHVTLELKKGEVLALVGENGAGKSTLIKVLSGANVPEGGEVWIDGQQITQFNPKTSLEHGVRVMYQELNNFETISVAENIFAGHIPVKGPFHLTDKAAMYKQSSELMARVGLNVYPGTTLGRLSVAERQLVEIAKALSSNTKVLVMDEPTAALNDTEVENLFRIIETVKNSGTSVIYISHRLDEIFRIADRVQVMRDGRSVFVSDIKDTNKPEIVANMVGNELGDIIKRDYADGTDEILKVENLKSKYYRNASFHLCRGEVVALYGLMGAGQSEMMETLFGVHEYTEGSVTIKGEKVSKLTPAKAMKYGIGYVPSERKQDGLYLNHSISENIVISCLRKILTNGLISFKKEDTLSANWIKELNIRTVSAKKKVGALSGGNQQKVVMAKWLSTDPDILLLNEPTRGVDVGAKAEIYHIIEEDMLNKGKGVVVVSSDLPEILSISDRVYVFCEGEIVKEFKHEEITSRALLECALGGLEHAAD